MANSNCRSLWPARESQKCNISATSGKSRISLFTCGGSRCLIWYNSGVHNVLSRSKTINFGQKDRPFTESCHGNKFGMEVLVVSVFSSWCAAALTDGGGRMILLFWRNAIDCPKLASRPTHNMSSGGHRQLCQMLPYQVAFNWIPGTTVPP